jgi:N-acetylglucosamine-6-phosphate deacetylase
MVLKVGVPLHEAIVMATDTPAYVTGLTTKGQFKIGSDADFVVISPDLEVVKTFSGGREIFNHTRANLTA